MKKKPTEGKDHFDFASIYANDEGVDADAVSHGLTRDEIETGLQGLGLSKNERAVVLAKVCDRLGMRTAIASATRLDRKTVAAILRRGSVLEALNRLQRGDP